VIAAIAVLVTLLWPGLVSKLFRIRTEAVTEDTNLRPVGSGDVPVPPQTPSEKAPPAPSR
jgi:hypothetical protein